MGTDWYKNKMREEVARMNLPPKIASHLLAGLDLDGKTVTVQQLEEQIKEVNEQLGESDKKDLGEEALIMADKAGLGPHECKSVAKEEQEKEGEEERILFMAEQSPSPRLRASA